MPSETVLGESASDVKAAEAILRQNRIAAYRELRQRLREVYVADVLRVEQEQIAALEPARDAAEQKARDDFRKLFEAYAAERGARVARLALIAGFPDPDPRSLRQPVSDNSLIKQRTAEARRLRNEIANLDLDYETAARKLAASTGQDMDAALTQIKVNMEYARTQAEDRARHDAASQVRTIEAGLGQSLASKGATVLPPLPDATEATGTSPSEVRQPEVNPMTQGHDVESRMRRLHAELTIWLSVNGYREVSEPTQGQDRTSEFAQWRRSHHLGL